MLRRIIMVLTAGALMVPLAACDFTARVECQDNERGQVVCEGDSTLTPPTPRPTRPPATTPPTTTRPPVTDPPVNPTVPPVGPPTTTPGGGTGEGGGTGTAIPVTTDPTTPPTTTTPPPADAQTAAQRLGWGQPRWADEFEYTGRPNPQLWSLPGSSCWTGHAGKGRRCPENSTVANGVLTQVGEPGGDTGWMASEVSWYRGRLETRMRVVDTPGRDNEFHPVLLMWPTAEDFPVGGEIDYAEMTSTSDSVDFFLHYGANNNQTHSEKRVNILDWHNYAYEWDAACIRGFIDGEKFFEDCNASHLPPRQMFATIQLDYFPDSSPGPGETRMQVDWIRSYAL